MPLSHLVKFFYHSELYRLFSPKLLIIFFMLSRAEAVWWEAGVRQRRSPCGLIINKVRSFQFGLHKEFYVEPSSNQRTVLLQRPRVFVMTSHGLIMPHYRKYAIIMTSFSYLDCPKIKLGDDNWTMYMAGGGCVRFLLLLPPGIEHPQPQLEGNN